MKKNSDYIVYAHRGAFSYAPENTMSSFLLGIELKSFGTEEEIKLANENGLGVRLWGVFNEKIMEDVYSFNIQE